MTPARDAEHCAERFFLGPCVDLPLAAVPLRALSGPDAVAAAGGRCFLETLPLACQVPPRGRAPEFSASVCVQGHRRLDVLSTTSLFVSPCQRFPLPALQFLWTGRCTATACIQTSPSSPSSSSSSSPSAPSSSAAWSRSSPIIILVIIHGHREHYQRHNHHHHHQVVHGLVVDRRRRPSSSSWTVPLTSSSSLFVFGWDLFIVGWGLSCFGWDLFIFLAGAFSMFGSDIFLFGWDFFYKYFWVFDVHGWREGALFIDGGRAHVVAVAVTLPLTPMSGGNERSRDWSRIR